MFKVREIAFSATSGSAHKLAIGLTHEVIDTGFDGDQDEVVGLYEGELQAEVVADALNAYDLNARRAVLTRFTLDDHDARPGYVQHVGRGKRAPRTLSHIAVH